MSKKQKLDAKQLSRDWKTETPTPQTITQKTETSLPKSNRSIDYGPPISKVVGASCITISCVVGAFIGILLLVFSEVI